MAFVVPTKRGRFELRESRSTPDGPRSRTLATFGVLDAKAIEKALDRATRPLDVEHIRNAALRAGAPVAPRPIDEATQTTLRLLARGERPSPMLRKLLRSFLGEEGHDTPTDVTASAPSAAARSAAEWIGTGVEERGAALNDLLLLADALPARARSPEIEFPRISTAGR